MRLTTKSATLQFRRLCRQVRDVCAQEGIAGLVDRLRRVAARALAPESALLPVVPYDVIAADLSRPFHPPPIRVTADTPLSVNWVLIPPGPRAGGYTTLFRIIRYLSAHGYENRVYFYNVFRADHAYYASIARDHYGFSGKVIAIEEGMEDAHAVVATSWPTAYAVFNAKCSGVRAYLVQDFEPHFYPYGSLSLLAENTYRMGFHAITAGPWLAEKLSAEYGMSADSFPFGSDGASYHRLGDTKRSGIVFYARQEAARRGYELGVMALQAFAKRRPDVDIHCYGGALGNLPFRAIDHGRVSANELNHIYNQCYAGLSLSLTNVSLVPHEMLAAGCIPVVNEAAHNRLVLQNRYVRYAQPSPATLAEALDDVVSTSEFESVSRAAAASVTTATWDAAGAAVDASLRRIVLSHCMSIGVRHIPQPSCR